mgnify:FL=1
MKYLATVYYSGDCYAIGNTEQEAIENAKNGLPFNEVDIIRIDIDECDEDGNVI